MALLGARSLALKLYKRLPTGLRRLVFWGRRHECPVCESRLRRFVAGGIHKEMEGTRCPVCGSEERHRMAWLFLAERAKESGREPERVLHIAPAWCLERRLERRWGSGYLAGNIDGGDGRIAADLTDLSFEDGSLDLVYCCHVLEHIPEDVRAMREILRVLAPDGWALVQVPITADRTREIASVSSAAERERLYGQSDHVRRYGRDFADRLRLAGLSVRVCRPSDLLSHEARIRYAIGDDEEIFECTRPDRETM